MLNWLFSSFTYLPNFIIWLPSFSSPWLVQLASKCHLAIFAFAWFLDFLHSVKKVSKPSIFCKINCVSKRTLVVLMRILCSTAFLKANISLILFFLSFVWFISGVRILLGVIFSGGEFSLGEIFSGANFWGIFFTGKAFIVSIFIAGNFLGRYFPDT